MKIRMLSIIAVAAICATSAVAQSVIGTPEDNRLTPRTGTFYINTMDTINNTKTESLGVAIANNGNVLIGWEDDGDGLQDLEAVWTLYNSAGQSITPDTLITTVDPNYAGQTLTSRFLSYFRADKSAVSGRTSWGPKIKANLFGDGIGMGATAFDLGIEVVELAPIQFNAAGDNAGDFPAVQLLDNTGKPIGILSGVDDAYADVDGDIRIADWEYLSNGNVVIVGESRQQDDLMTKYGGAAAGRHAIYRIVDLTGKEVKAVGLVSETPNPNEIWHGVGITRNGFGVRFAQAGRTIVRLFDNAGNPVSTNLDIGTLTGNAVAAGGGRGDGAGFHGNGNDAYVTVNSGRDDQNAIQVWVTVLNTNGTVRYSKALTDDVKLNAVGRVDAAIDSKGRVLGVFNATIVDEFAPSLVMGRMLDPTGKTNGPTFYISEQEGETVLAAYESIEPRVTVRGDLFAVVWESKNNPDAAGIGVVAGRLFGLLYEPGSIESVGLQRIVPDTPIIVPGANALGNWEPYSSVLGNSVFLIEGNTFAENTIDRQRFVVALQPVDGKPMKLVEGFYADNGTPFKAEINASRQNGNPGRVAGDKRPKAVNYMVGAEASPHVYPEFQSDNRWTLGFDRLADGRYGTIQTYKLDLATLMPTPLCKAQDSANGRLTSGDPQGNNQITRFGGELACLDNGNFVSVVEDRSKMLRPDGNCGAATIFAPDGSIVTETFKVADGDIWSNVTAYRGGFAVRMNGIIYFYDNAGNLKGQVDQATSGRSFDRGRGDGTRIQSHINSPYVFLTGTTGAKLVSLAVFDSRDQSFVAVADVSEPGYPGTFDRSGLAVDALNRVVVAWESQPAGYEQVQVVARVMTLDEAKKTITPLTASFLPFLNAAKTGGIRTYRMNMAMTTKEIMVAAKGEINLQNKPELGKENCPNEVNFYTVITHPAPAADPTTPIGPPPLVTYYNVPAGDWTYVLDGSKAAAGAPDSGFTSLDGSWSHDNGSDTWDGSALGGTFGDTNRPGGVSTIDGYLRLQDTGDPRDHGFPGDSPIPSNRKIYFGRNITPDGASATVLDTGVTLHFRTRIPTSGLVDTLHPDGNPGGAGPQPYPAAGDGYLPHDGGKDSFGIKQANGGIVSFALATAADTGSAAGLIMNNLNGKTISGNVDPGDAGTPNLLPLDPTVWHEFWITLQADPTGPGTHKVSIYLDGSLTPQTFAVTAGDGSDYSGISYLGLGLGATGQSGALDVDYFTYKLGAIAPTESSLLRITGISAAAGQVTITWAGGTAPYVLQKKTNVADATWVDVQTTQNKSVTVPIAGSSAFFRIVVK